MHAANQPSSYRMTMGNWPCREAFWHSTLLAIFVLTCCSGAAADEWMAPSVTDATWSDPVADDQPTRLPPFDLASYDALAMQDPIDPNRQFLGYDEGFVIADHGRGGAAPSDAPFLMRVNGWAQLRHTLFESDGPNPNQNTFSLERVRLVLSGQMHSPSLEYLLTVDGNSDRSMEARLLDAFVSYDVGHDVFGCEANRLGIRAGKWKLPFSRARVESARRLQFTDRATANIFFDLNRAIGVGLYGETDALFTPINFETAVFNGFDTGGISTNRDGGLDQNIGWSMRTYTDLFSEFGRDGEPDLSWHLAPALRLGSGLAFARVAADGEIEFDRKRVVDSGATLASLLPPSVTAYDVGLYHLDAHWKYRGLTLIGECYFRYITQFSGGSIPGLFDQGYVLQTGYFVVPQKLELHARWARIVGDSGTLGMTEQSSDEVAAGFAWYLKGHDAKLVFDASHLNGAPVRSARLDLLPGDVGWLLRTQFQLGF
jgi:hypothetical protein